MTQPKIKNTPVSVRQRLLNIAKNRGEDFQYVITRYALGPGLGIVISVLAEITGLDKRLQTLTVPLNGIYYQMG
jgi:hypothetical protein